VEALAPDPLQPAGPRDDILRSCDPPRLLAWVVRCDDIGAATAAVAEVTGTPPVVQPGSRTTAAGLEYRYHFAALDPGWPAASALPGIVGWQGAHPADGGTAAVSWSRLRVETPDHEVLAEVCRRLSLDVLVLPGEENRLVAVLDRDGREIQLA
jgi:hypothetical protein